MKKRKPKKPGTCISRPKKQLRKGKARQSQAVAADTIARRKHDKPRLAMATVDGWCRRQHFSAQEENLRMALEVAVPFRIEEVRRWPWDVVKMRADECSYLIAEGGDALMFGRASLSPNQQKKQKEKRERETGDVWRDLSTRNVFSALVDSLAIGALQPGGARLFGLHFEAER